MGITARLADLAGAAMFTGAEVAEVQRLEDLFHLVTLESPGFASATPAPGSKVQIRTAPGSLTMRTYTPMNWDAERSRISLLAYAHSSGPGAEWFRDVDAADSLQLFGPGARSPRPRPANGSSWWATRPASHSRPL